MVLAFSVLEIEFQGAELIKAENDSCTWTPNSAYRWVGASFVCKIQRYKQPLTGHL